MEGEEARLLWPVVGRHIGEMPYFTGKVRLCKGIFDDFGSAGIRGLLRSCTKRQDLSCAIPVPPQGKLWRCSFSPSQRTIGSPRRSPRDEPHHRSSHPPPGRPQPDGRSFCITPWVLSVLRWSAMYSAMRPSARGLGVLETFASDTAAIFRGHGSPSLPSASRTLPLCLSRIAQTQDSIRT